MKLRRRAPATAAAVVLGATVLPGSQVLVVGAADGGEADYVVLGESGASASDVVSAINAAGGTVTGKNAAVGTFRVTGPATGFIEAVSASSAVFGATGSARSAGSRMPRRPRVPTPKSSSSSRATPAGHATAGLPRRWIRSTTWPGASRW